jgi:hypothetical protein
MSQEILVSSSIGICQTEKGLHYLQVIVDKEDEPDGQRWDYFIPITYEMKQLIEKSANLHCCKFKQKDVDESRELLGEAVLSIIKRQNRMI